MKHSSYATGGDVAFSRAERCVLDSPLGTFGIGSNFSAQLPGPKLTIKTMPTKNLNSAHTTPLNTNDHALFNDWARPAIRFFVVTDFLITCGINARHLQLSSLPPGQTIRPSGTRDKGKKSGTVPEIPGQLEPMV